MAQQAKNTTMKGFKWPATSNSTNSTVLLHQAGFVNPPIIVDTGAAIANNYHKSKAGSLAILSVSVALFVLVFALISYQFVIKNKYVAKKEKDIEIASYNQPSEPSRPVSKESAKPRVFGERTSISLPKGVTVNAEPKSESPVPMTPRSTNGFEEIDLRGSFSKRE
ncbi:hypothetical protein BDV96DRAFT_652436 [Lophiotrema nucula]|uniref:Uncharacterized protein n=1 Tax=Lophiotrema nucula TaxID=690887 RepID=A0A6A5YPE8_9PLEO|nr:hypothetical protein BDV96DRAFT_652436 [Lophiotrema nucula]